MVWANLPPVQQEHSQEAQAFINLHDYLCNREGLLITQFYEFSELDTLDWPNTWHAYNYLQNYANYRDNIEIQEVILRIKKEEKRIEDYYYSMVDEK